MKLVRYGLLPCQLSQRHSELQLVKATISKPCQFRHMPTGFDQDMYDTIFVGLALPVLIEQLAAHHSCPATNIPPNVQPQHPYRPHHKDMSGKLNPQQV